MATFETPSVIQDGSNDNIANTPLGVAAIETAREKIGVDDHAYFIFEKVEWFVRQLSPHSFWIRQATAMRA